MLASWRFMVWLGLLNAAFTLITIAIGIAGLVLGFKVIHADEDSMAEIQAANIITDALPSWTERTFTEIRVLDDSDAWPVEGDWVDLFTREWPGVDYGCADGDGNIYTE